MNSVEKLLQTLCPHGVEFKTLEEVFTIGNGYTPSKKNPEFWENGNIPWFRMEDIRQNGRILEDSIQHITPKALKGGKLFPKGSIIISTTATIGEHALLIVDSLANQRFTFLSKKVNCDIALDEKYFFYHCFVLGEWCRKNINVSGFASVDMAAFRKYKFPLPPLEVQREIVKILDTFTELNTELNTELKLRKKQYEYYRNWLLSFGDVDASKEGAEQRLRDKSYPKALKALLLSLCPHGVEFRKLGEVGRFTRGNGLLKSNLQTHGKPVVHYGQIYTRYGLATEKTISYVSETLFAKLKKAKPKDILIAVTSENVKDVGKSTVWLGDEEVAFSGEMYSYSTDQNPKFIAYYFQTSKFQKEKEKIVTGTKVIRIHEDDLKQIKIPLPPLEVQREIVKILDDFSTLTEDLSSGIPAEIAARKKQYEYYRDKLLTFTPLIKEGE
ncbi:restriction endonuclease subunit S [Helicobacter mustelae]|uniref:Putative type I restriction-modification system S protein n=1 Tax=Helicobacter mustelae (strain ATCC 43772 / CCUG 25715 / CIP 103759 / LMG 18044 / NCTC 12198 / R85-136P) TaxID=679897 RepID=D3UJF2_HELM1|nr:restriction endonuclease subunit S [Helicobacter mustelae]CBG40628.1 putative type I restriction-modification system S protein [Helicobacter mustelae 12198]SQH72125.1 type I restriction-modification system S protein [Helicobacter mustelae]